jgi:hypothetical protein
MSLITSGSKNSYTQICLSNGLRSATSTTVGYASASTLFSRDRQSTIDGHHRHSSGIGVFFGSVLTYPKKWEHFLWLSSEPSSLLPLSDFDGFG